MKMEQVEGLCTAGAGDVVQEVTVESQSATAVYFTVVPLIIGNIPIIILAHASHNIHDKIQKELKVVVLSHTVNINQINKVQIPEFFFRTQNLVRLISVYRERGS